MAQTGRAIRDALRDAARETPERIAERARHRASCERAVREREARWPVLTAANTREAIQWQERRIVELDAE